MKEFFYHFFVILKNIIDFIGFDGSWLLTLHKEIFDTIDTFFAELKSTEGIINKLGYILAVLFDLWIYIIIMIPIILFMSEISSAIQVMFAKFYFSVFITFLPFILFFAVIQFIERVFQLFGNLKKKSRQNRFKRSLVYTSFLTTCYVLNDMYPEQIQQFLT